MKLYIKILLTIPWLVELAYVITFYNVDFFKWINNKLVPFEYQTVVGALICWPAIIYLIYRIWTFKNIDKNTKGNWTVLLVVVNIITMPIYIWRKDDVFVKKNTIVNSEINSQ